MTRSPSTLSTPDHAGDGVPRAFVCGWPIEHSKSPRIHRYWLERHNLPGSYEKIAVPPDGLADFVARLKRDKWAGGNFTIPHKERMVALVDELDPAARSIGAVNTVWFEDNSLVGGNTDWIGFSANLDQQAQGWSAGAAQRTAIVIGAGGAARGILYALGERGFGNIILANRTLENAESLARDFGTSVTPVSLDSAPRAMAGASLLVNTSSMGMHGAQRMPNTIHEAMQDLATDAVVNDIVYVPLETSLLAAAYKAGRKSVDGLGMLLHQAAPGFEKWFGILPEVTPELRRHILAPVGDAQSERTA